jgi:pyruvate/2-oxoacid:ferredoxin oxidoreductase alpha subunit
MRIFALKKIEQVKGKISFFKLLIDQKCEFDEFCNLLESKKDTSKLRSVFSTMDSVANLNRLPKTKFRELEGRPAGDNVKEYEIKKKPYRVYLFKDSEGNIVVFGSIKGNQKRDIKRFRAMKIEYLKSKEL